MTGLVESAPPGEVFHCPKRMEFGPCGGVGATGRCEVSTHRCTFLDLPLPRWPGGRAGAAPHQEVAARGVQMRRLLADRSVVVADFPGRALDLASLRACAGALAGSVDAVLCGDAGSARVQFSPAHRAAAIQAAGLTVWAGLNCRDRNRVALEGELASLAAIGVAGVHCVTGDHPGVGHRPDAQAVFDLDSTRLAALATSFGHLVSVAEAPAAPPIHLRPVRLIEKVKAGAEVCFVNHCGPAARVEEFIRRTRQLDVPDGRPQFVACVPVVIDRGSAELLRSFTSLVLPDGYLDGILSSTDPRTAGIEAAVQLSRELRQVPGVGGINLSGGPAAGAEVPYARALAAIGRELRIR